MNSLSFQSVFLSLTEIFLWLIASYLLISLFEYFVHKHFMHQKRFSKGVYRFSSYLLEVFESHAVRHHVKWYRKFDYEPDAVSREENLEILLVDIFAMLLLTMPAWATLMWFNLWGGIAFIGVFFIHRFFWNTIHRQMHMPEDVIFRNWSVYRYLARHHFLHHQNAAKNFNVVFPVTDAFFGSVGKAKFKDVREMLRLGHLMPRSAHAQNSLKRQGMPLLGANR
ncbi:MAG: hypothetical protein ACXWAT_06405 [Methylobacter sp.]